MQTGIPIAVFQLTGVGFEEGSLWTWVQAKVSILTLAATLMTSAAAYNPAHKAWEDHAFHGQVIGALVNAPAVKYHNFRFSEDELQSNAIRGFNYDELGISADERLFRIALVQLALRVHFQTDIVIDGRLGPDTTEHLKRFAKEKNCTANINDKFLRAALRQSLLPPPAK